MHGVPVPVVEGVGRHLLQRLDPIANVKSELDTVSNWRQTQPSQPLLSWTCTVIIRNNRHSRCCHGHVQLLSETTVTAVVVMDMYSYYQKQPSQPLLSWTCTVTIRNNRHSRCCHGHVYKLLSLFTIYYPSYYY